MSVRIVKHSIIVDNTGNKGHECSIDEANNREQTSDGRGVGGEIRRTESRLGLNSDDIQHALRATSDFMLFFMGSLITMVSLIVFCIVWYKTKD